MVTPALRIDRETCVGAGMCVVAAPDIFDQSDDDGRVVLIGDAADAGALDRIREAVMLCPSGALTLEEPAPGG